jgi:hypothetical protein
VLASDVIEALRGAILEDKMRFQLDFDDQGEKLVLDLERRTGVKTHRELFNNALTLLDWATEQAMQGRNVASLDMQTKQSKELLMPVLRYAAGIGEAQRNAANTPQSQAALAQAAAASKA